MSGIKDAGKMEPITTTNQLKPNTIWHAAALPRDEQPLDERPDENFHSKKRRVSCGIEIVKCNICGHHFDSPAQLCDHLIHHDGDYRYNPIYKCSYGQCMFRTDDRPLMKHHISRVHLKSDQALVSKKHRNRKLLRPTILCSTCPMVFATESELWQHTPTCKEYRCQFCGQHFWTIEKRYAHEMIYHEDEFEYEEEEVTCSGEGDEDTENGTETENRDEEAPGSTGGGGGSKEDASNSAAADKQKTEVCKTLEPEEKKCGNKKEGEESSTSCDVPDEGA